MAQIRPVSDLRNKFTLISTEVHENNETVILTKNGRPDMVVMSYEAYNHKKFEEEVYLKLMEAELESRTTTEKLSHDEVFADLRAMVMDMRESKNI